MAAQIQERKQQLFAFAEILTFTDKMIDMKTVNKIRRMLAMTIIGWIIEQEKLETIRKVIEETV